MYRFLIQLSLLSRAAAFMIISTTIFASVGLGDPQNVSATTSEQNQAEDPTCTGRGAGGWAFSAKVSPNDGLVVENAYLGPRLLARMISVPYFEISADWDSTGTVTMKRAELTAHNASTHSRVLTTTLLPNFRCNTGGTESIGVEATYLVDGLPDGVTMLVKQNYRFDHRIVIEKDRCEASGELPCARFWPTVTWGANDPKNFIRSVRIVQRLEFEPDLVKVSHNNDGDYVNVGDVYRDRATIGGMESRQSVESLGTNGSMKHEDRVLAIKNGQRDQDVTWDSWHQTYRAGTSSPSFNPLKGHVHPGCSECVHVHWAWGGALTTYQKIHKAHRSHLFQLMFPALARNQFLAENLVLGIPLDFTDGKPEILDGSKQTTNIAIVRYSPAPEEVDPWERGYGALLADTKDPKLSDFDGSRPVIFWDMETHWDTKTKQMGTPPTGVDIDGADFPLGDAAWPQLDNKLHGGNGSMFFAPARLLAATPTDAALSNMHPADHNALSIVPEWPQIDDGSQPSSDPSSLNSGGQVGGELHSALPAGWVLPVAVKGPCSLNGPFWLSITPAHGQQVLNADRMFDAAPEMIGYYVPLYDNITPGGASPTFPQGKVLTQFNCDANASTVTYHAYVVFSSKPTKENIPSIKFLGAPDDIDLFIPYKEMDILPPSPLGERCSPPPAKLPPDIPNDVTCLSVVNADLDGNEILDQLLLWSKGVEYGAVVHLDDGTQDSLKADQTWPIPYADISPANNPFYPVLVTDINMDRRSEVIVNVDIGANTFHDYIFTVTTARRLHIVTGQDGKKLDIGEGGGAGGGGAWGCVVVNGQQLLAQTGYTAFWNTGTNPRYGWSATYLGFDGTTTQPVGWQGGVAIDAERRAQEMDTHGSNRCEGSIPDIGTLQPLAQTPEEAVSKLLDAAIKGDKGAGATYLAGTFTDENEMNTDFGGEVDPWRYLTEVYQIHLSGWINRPVICDPVYVKNTDTKETHCYVVTADGSQLYSLLTQLPPNDGGNWTVSSVWSYVEGQ